jgi:hypothetical protein
VDAVAGIRLGLEPIRCGEGVPAEKGFEQLRGQLGMRAAVE